VPRRATRIDAGSALSCCSNAFSERDRRRDRFRVPTSLWRSTGPTAESVWLGARVDAGRELARRIAWSAPSVRG